MADTRKQRRELLKNAYAQTWDGHWHEAMEGFRQAKAMDPQDLAPCLGLAYACIGAGQLDDALTELREACSAMPSDPWPAEMLATLLAQRRTLEEVARASVQSAVGHHVAGSFRLAEVWREKVAAVRQAGTVEIPRFDPDLVIPAGPVEKEPVFQTLIPGSETDGDASPMGASGRSTQRPIIGDLAAVDVENTDSTDSAALRSLEASRRYMEQKRYLAAMEEIFLGVGMAPECLPLHVQLAEISSAQGRVEEAVAKYLIVAETYEMRDDVDGAMGVLRRVKELAPLDTVARRRLIHLLVDQNQPEEAVNICCELAEAHNEMTELDEAMEAFQQALDICRRIPGSREQELKVLYPLIDLQLQAGLQAEAAEAAGRLVELEPACGEEYGGLIRQHSASEGEDS